MNARNPWMLETASPNGAMAREMAGDELEGAVLLGH